MALPIAGLVLLSAALHPLWNALAKRDPHQESALLAIMAWIVALSGGAALASGVPLLSAREVLPEIAASAAGMLMYLTGLGRTLRRGDLSLFYPIVRSSPLFIVVVGVVLLGHRYGWSLLAGVTMVLAGAVLLQDRRDLRPAGHGITLAWAVLAMAGTGVYSLADAAAVRKVDPLVMLFWVQLIALPAYGVVTWRARDSARPGERESWVARQLLRMTMGAMACASYALILVAYSWGGNVAAVTSVRQASIPFSVLIGGLWLGERAMAPRLGAALLLAAGIVVIVAAG